MRRVRTIVALAICLSPVLNGCGALSRVKGRTKATLDRFGKGGGEEDGGAVEAPREVKVGTVRLVRETLGFVLIESTGSRPPPRVEIQAVRKGQPVATLKVSPEAKTGFLVADVIAGMPKVGDLVVWTKSGAPARSEGDVGPLPEPPPSIADLPPLEPVADPRLLRPAPEIDPGGVGSSLDDPEAELENELRTLRPPL